jgi:predicted dinucleotide-binding enzyme
MRVAIIGADTLGRVLARRLLASGHDIVFGVNALNAGLSGLVFGFDTSAAHST